MLLPFLDVGIYDSFFFFFWLGDKERIREVYEREIVLVVIYLLIVGIAV